MKIGSYRVYLKNKDLLILVIMFGWATAYYIDTGHMKQAKLMLALIQPVYFLMVGLLGIYLYRTLKIEKIQPEDKLHSVEETVTAPTEQMETERQDGQIDPLNKKRMTIYLAMAALYIVLFDTVGFILSTIIYSGTTMFFLGMRKPLQLLLIPTITALLIHYIFSTFFYVELPLGLFLTAD